MKLKALLPLLFLVVVAGCSSNQGSDGVSDQNKQDLSSGAALAKKVDGDYDKLSDSEKQVILKMANGDEKQARQLCKMMAHPPNEGKAGPAGGNGAPPARPGG